MSQDKIFLDYDQAALDQAYDQRFWAPNAAEIIRWYAEHSAAVYACLPSERNIAYGHGAKERFDLFRTDKADAPTVIFVHGGAWRLLSKEDSVFPAEVFVSTGVNYIALDFDIIPDARLPAMIAQVRQAIAWLWREGPGIGINRERLYLCGHSSGAHLAAMALVTDWQSHGLPHDVIKGGLCASGSYDLEAVVLSARGDYLELDNAEVIACSPIHFVERLACPLVVAYGGRESPEFIRQSEDFHARILRSGGRANLLMANDDNHFEISKSLAEPDGLLARTMLDLIGM